MLDLSHFINVYVSVVVGGNANFDAVVDFPRY